MFAFERPEISTIASINPFRFLKLNSFISSSLASGIDFFNILGTNSLIIFALSFCSSGEAFLRDSSAEEPLGYMPEDVMPDENAMSYYGMAPGVNDMYGDDNPDFGSYR